MVFGLKNIRESKIMSIHRFFYAVDYNGLEACINSGSELNPFIDNHCRADAVVTYGDFIGYFDSLINSNEKMACLGDSGFKFLKEANIMAMNVGYYLPYLTQDIYLELCECDFAQAIDETFGQDWREKDALEGMLEDIRHVFKVASENNLVVLSFDA